jgi:hypothetical protein
MAAPSSHDEELKEKWMTSPWAHIETAMAYQIGPPILILREEGVVDDGAAGSPTQTTG